MNFLVQAASFNFRLLICLQWLHLKAFLRPKLRVCQCYRWTHQIQQDSLRSLCKITCIDDLFSNLLIIILDLLRNFYRKICALIAKNHLDYLACLFSYHQASILCRKKALFHYFYCEKSEKFLDSKTELHRLDHVL